MDSRCQERRIFRRNICKNYTLSKQAGSEAV